MRLGVWNTPVEALVGCHNVNGNHWIGVMVIFGHKDVDIEDVEIEIM